MSENTLITALEEDARAEVERLIEDARASASAILEDIRAEASSERQRRTEEVDSELKGTRAALLNAASMKASGEALAVRHGLIEKALEAALERFALMPEKEYAEFLNLLIEELLADWEKRRPLDTPVVLLSPADMKLVKTSLEARGDDKIFLGAALVNKDGTVSHENTVSSRLSMARAALTPLVNSVLFDGALK